VISVSPPFFEHRATAHWPREAECTTTDGDDVTVSISSEHSSAIAGSIDDHLIQDTTATNVGVRY
jgi:hypothetical protein